MSTDPITGNQYVPVQPHPPINIRHILAVILGLVCSTLILLTLVMSIVLFVHDGLYDVQVAECNTTCYGYHNYTCDKEICNAAGCVYVNENCLAYSMNLTLWRGNNTYTKLLYDGITAGQPTLKCEATVRCYYAIDKVFTSRSITSSLTLYRIEPDRYLALGIALATAVPILVLITFACIVAVLRR
jgi:hypothetical protein